MKKLLWLLALVPGLTCAQNYYNITNATPGNQTAIYAQGYGVVADGVTSDDIALKAAADACNAVGGHLILPSGTILLDGTGGNTITLNGCWMQGSNGSAADSGVPNGTTFNLTSVSIIPFYLKSNWKVSDVAFYWPNQTSGTTTYPPLFSDNGVNPVKHGVIDHITIINAWDGLTLTGIGAGDVKITNSTMWACHNLFTLVNIGDSWLIQNNRFTPGAWLNLFNFSAAVKTAIDTAVANGNALLYIKSGAVVAVNMDGQTFDWRYFIYVESGGLMGQSLFDVSQDGIGTIIDSSSGGVYAAQNGMTGTMSSCGTFSYTSGTFTGKQPCFNLGTGSGLYLHDMSFGTSRGDFADIVGGAGVVVVLDSVSIGGIGGANDGSDYYFLHDTGSGAHQLSVRNSRIIGKGTGADAHCCHGINSGVDYAGNLFLLNNYWSYMTDIFVSGVNQSQRLFIEGNVAQSSYASGSSLVIPALVNNTQILYAGNYWDIDPSFPNLVHTGRLDTPLNVWQWGIPVGLPPSGFFANNGVYVVGQAPSSSATLSVSATSGSVTATFSAATLLGTAADVGRVITILDSTYKYCTITAQSSTTVATCTVSGGTLSGTGPFANAAVWLSGTPTTNTTAFSVPLQAAFPAAYMWFPANAIVSGSTAGLYYTTCVTTTVCTVYNNVYSSGAIPRSITSPTAFSSTGPGAFAQSTAYQNLLVVTIPSNSLGPNGQLIADMTGIRNSNTDTVALRANYGATSFGQASVASVTWYGYRRALRNAGVTNSQVFLNSNVISDQATVNTPTPIAYGAEDSTVNKNFVVQGALTTAATDWLFVLGGTVTINYSP